MVPFRVIIVGGSVAGLALANMLEQYGIDFVVLEKHESIAPHLGAGFAMLPHGARILDQLGCYNALEKLSTPIDTMVGYDENAEKCTKISNIGVILEQSLGYKMGFLERQQVVQGLFDNLRDKSKIHNSCCVSRIHLTDDQVMVETNSGGFEGDLVVGADGVHSYVRHFECCYNAMFGTSVAPEGLIENQAFKGFKSDRSFLCSPGKGRLLYWIAMFKNGEKTSGDGIPRYTRDDCDRLATNFADDIIKPGVRLGDMYRNARKATLVPLEQGVLSTCFYKRIVLVGDSWHKINPITGQGGNTAIAGAAYLTDGLMDLLDREETPTQASIEKLFSDYQQNRGSISKTLSENAHIMQRMEALETPFLKFFQLNVMRFLPLKFIRKRLLTSFNSGLLLKRLPPPSRSGTVQIGPHTQKAHPGPLSFLVKLWVLFLIPMTVVYYSLA
ncbi:unnamed protein product [Penicillium salamii]|uniref:FAD-binding domain-containing protein n=1 Tax=Penicillium salamii TaxID=1612424 RepID=A0A9W4J5F8_9EURO|nr:unnamed protein product [Penicillium salamii]CAG7989974.1 unnamed protein product [Penicillium salamii]CAG8273923.1 unnamed protein product [Penicillium salamii]CAG8353936.1 unnamed protein product [Penicillium salamii]CAG8357487.1 unnamed protein product [Penicillium salamii]